MLASPWTPDSFRRLAPRDTRVGGHLVGMDELWIAVFAIAVVGVSITVSRFHRGGWFRRKLDDDSFRLSSRTLCVPKPRWVTRELIRLKAHHPKLGSLRLRLGELTQRRRGRRSSSYSKPCDRSSAVFGVSQLRSVALATSRQISFAPESGLRAMQTRPRMSKVCVNTVSVVDASRDTSWRRRFPSKRNVLPGSSWAYTYEQLFVDWKNEPPAVLPRPGCQESDQAVPGRGARILG